MLEGKVDPQRVGMHPVLNITVTLKCAGEFLLQMFPKNYLDGEDTPANPMKKQSPYKTWPIAS